MLQYVTPLAFILPDDYREAAPFRRLASDAHVPLQTGLSGASCRRPPTFLGPLQPSSRPEP